MKETKIPVLMDQKQYDEYYYMITHKKRVHKIAYGMGYMLALTIMAAILLITIIGTIKLLAYML